MPIDRSWNVDPRPAENIRRCFAPQNEARTIGPYAQPTLFTNPPAHAFRGFLMGFLILQNHRAAQTTCKTTGDRAAPDMPVPGPFPSPGHRLRPPPPPPPQTATASATAQVTSAATDLHCAATDFWPTREHRQDPARANAEEAGARTLTLGKRHGDDLVQQLQHIYLVLSF